MRDLESQLVSQGLVVGCHDRTGVRVNEEAVLDGPIGPFIAGQVLLRDRSVAAVVLSINEASVLRTGLPFDRFDVLVLAGPHVALPKNSGTATREGVFRGLLAAILPACDGKVVTVKGAGLNISGYEHLAPGLWVNEPVEPDRVVDGVVEALAEADERHELGFS